MQPQDEVRLLGNCRHCFHASCVEPWFERSTRCPTCRDDLMGVVADAGGLEASAGSDEEM